MPLAKVALQKMFEKFLILAGGVSEMIDAEEEPEAGLSIMLCHPKDGEEDAEPQLVICHVTWDSDGKPIATVPLAALLPKRYIDRMSPDWEKSFQLTELFYNKLLERMMETKSFKKFVPKLFDPGQKFGRRDYDFNAFVSDGHYPHELN